MSVCAIYEIFWDLFTDNFQEYFAGSGAIVTFTRYEYHGASDEYEAYSDEYLYIYIWLTI